MYTLIFYRDRRGKEAFLDYLRSLDKRSDKDSRVKLVKIYDCLEILRQLGTMAGVPYVKHIEGEIWELRPLYDRILFATWDGQRVLILHHFAKKSRITPRREIDQAKRNLSDYRKRSDSSDSKNN